VIERRKWVPDVAAIADQLVEDYRTETWAVEGLRPSVRPRRRRPQRLRRSILPAMPSALSHRGKRRPRITLMFVERIPGPLPWRAGAARSTSQTRTGPTRFPCPDWGHRVASAVRRTTPQLLRR
jgi:hypothetical protein